MNFYYSIHFPKNHEVNSKLSYDLEALKRHIELVIEHNSNVI